MPRFNSATQIPGYSNVAIAWEEKADLDQEAKAQLRFDDGRCVAITRKVVTSQVQVKNGPFSTGRSWYVIDSDIEQRELPNLQEVIAAIEAAMPAGSV